MPASTWNAVSQSPRTMSRGLNWDEIKFSDDTLFNQLFREERFNYVLKLWSTCYMHAKIFSGNEKKSELLQGGILFYFILYFCTYLWERKFPEIWRGQSDTGKKKVKKNRRCDDGTWELTDLTEPRLPQIYIHFSLTARIRPQPGRRCCCFLQKLDGFFLLHQREREALIEAGKLCLACCRQNLEKCFWQELEESGFKVNFLIFQISFFSFFWEGIGFKVWVERGGHTCLGRTCW